MAPRKRQAPSGDRTPVLQEDAVLTFLAEHRIKPVNAYALWKWVVQHPAAVDWAEVPWQELKVSQRMAELLPRHFALRSSTVAERLDSADGSTTKFLVGPLSCTHDSDGTTRARNPIERNLSSK